MRNRPFAACRCRCLLDIAPCRRPLFAGWHDEFLLNDLRISTRLLVILTFYEKAHFFFGTLAPFFLASESPIAMACLRVFTRPPLPPFPLFNVPRLRRRIALSTVLPAALPYLRLPFLFAGMVFLFCNLRRGQIGLELAQRGAWVRENEAAFCGPVSVTQLDQHYIPKSPPRRSSEQGQDPRGIAAKLFRSFKFVLKTKQIARHNSAFGNNGAEF